jgi:hypothetical protein
MNIIKVYANWDVIFFCKGERETDRRRGEGKRLDAHAYVYAVCTYLSLGAIDVCLYVECMCVSPSLALSSSFILFFITLVSN